MESINCDRHGRVVTGEGPPTAARHFAYALLGGPLPNDSGANAVAHADRDHLRWLARISSRHAAPANREFSERVDADRERSELEWLAGISSRHDRQLRSVQSREAEIGEAQARLQSLIERLRIEEAQWDPAKHPRRGAPPNAGWFATKGGGGAAGSSGRPPSLLDRVRQRNSEVSELTGVVTPGMIRANRLAADLESAAKLPGEVARAAAAGLGTGGKAVANGFVTAIKDVVTLGLSPGQIEMLGVTQEDRDRGYDTAVKFSTASGQILIALGTLGIGTALSGGGAVVRVASGALVVFDTAGNAVGVVQGVADASQNGVTLSNGTKIAGSAFGLGANAKAAKGLTTARTAAGPPIDTTAPVPGPASTPAPATVPKSAPAAIAGFRVGKHSEMPSPRPGQHSHHGVMSKWMKSKLPGYDKNKAPAVLMPNTNHHATYGIFNKWRAQWTRKMGGTFDWSKVSEEDMRELSEQMFDAAKVPANIRQQYWKEFEKMLAVLRTQSESESWEGSRWATRLRF
jgi:hypothetical protein